MDIRLDMEGDEHLERRLVTTTVRARSLSKKLPARWARQLRDDVRRRARPFRRSGGYEKSIITRGNDVLTKHPAARRLEKGFVGRDSAGRIYHQAPRPHWRPAIEAAKRRAKADVMKELDLGNEG